MTDIAEHIITFPQVGVAVIIEKLLLLQGQEITQQSFYHFNDNNHVKSYTFKFYDFLSDMTFLNIFFFFFIDDSHGIPSLNFYENEERYHKNWHLLQVL